MNQEIQREFYAQTLVEIISALEKQADELDLTISVGEMWRRRRLAASSSGWLVLDKLAYYHRLLTAALSQLQSWSERNASETTRPISEILRTWSGGSAALMASIDAGLVAEHYAQALDHLEPNMMQEIVDAYPA